MQCLFTGSIKYHRKFDEFENSVTLETWTKTLQNEKNLETVPYIEEGEDWCRWGVVTNYHVSGKRGCFVINASWRNVLHRRGGILEAWT